MKRRNTEVAKSFMLFIRLLIQHKAVNFYLDNVYKRCWFTKKIDSKGVDLIEVSDYKRCRNTRTNTVHILFWGDNVPLGYLLFKFAIYQFQLFTK